MKKMISWLFGISIFVIFFDWILAGLKMAKGDYDIVAECYIALGCLAVILIFNLYRLLSNRCRHCGKLVQQPRAVYCPHCGKKMEGAI